MSYHSFASGVVNYGMPFAIKCCVTYKVPMETALAYVRRFAIEGYVI